MLHLFRVAIPSKLTLKLDLGEDLPAVCASPTQLRQVLINLVSNASDAMGGRTGEICVSTQLVKISSGFSVVNTANLPEGDYLRLRVSDMGCGMTRAVQAKMFDPFFSTKDAGRGLGLAVVQGIVRTHGGGTKVTSKLGKGTAFEILLPCVGTVVREPATIYRLKDRSMTGNSAFSPDSHSRALKASA
jgi:signal transduction histidine kinase